MPGKYVATAQVQINAPVEKVWEALTKPEIIKEYFFGTTVISDWKVGGPLNFAGSWEGKEYFDKGTILELEPNKKLKYNYLSSFSGLPDLPENYASVTNELSPSSNGTLLKITQDNIATEEAKKHSEDNWVMILDNLRKLVE